MAKQTLPGVRVGPLDPDATEHFGQVSGRTSARQLIRHHTAAHPPELTRALALPRDDERSTALVIGEIADVLEGDEDFLPKGAVIEGAAVRGARDRAQVLTYQYRVESGRTGKGFTEYDDRFADSVARGDEAVRIAELRKTGLPLTGEGHETDLHIGSARAEAAERRAAALSDENEKLRKQIQAQTDAGASAPGAGEDDGDEDEPVPGYADLNANDARALIKDDSTDPETVQAILEYERDNGGRKTVISAAEQRLDHTGG